MRSRLLYILFLLSGAAGLVYELVWVRELTFVFGGTTYAITTVLVAYMAGLGLGSFLAGKLCQRLTRPARWYGLLEICIGLYALAVPLLLGVAEPIYRGLYAHAADTPTLLTLFRFIVGAGVLLIPTTFMGATLPILVRHVTRHGGVVGRSVGHLYGINTLGAVLGVLAAGFWLIPALGLTHTTWVAAGTNGLVGLLAIFVLAAGATTTESKPRPKAAKTKRATPSKESEPWLPAPLGTGPRRLLLACFAVSGFAAMVYQITWTRALVLSIGSSTYSFSCILAAFILGLALGSLAVARWADRWRNPLLILGVMELSIGLVAVLIVPLYGQVPYWVQAIVSTHRDNYPALLRMQFLLVIAITFLPTFLMGAIFPLVTRTLATGGEEAGAATGRAYAVNTVGTIAGSFLAGFVLIRGDVLGVRNSIVLASVLSAAVGSALILWARPARAPQVKRGARPAAAGRSGAAGRLRAAPVGILIVVLIPVISWLAGGWDARVLSAGPYLGRSNRAIQSRIANDEMVFYADGVDQTVAVSRRRGAPDDLVLTVNGKPDASTTEMDLLTQLLLGHVPALLDRGGEQACVIGLGSGMTLSGLARYSSYKQIDCVEISDEVVRAASLFAPYTYDILSADPRVRLIRGDGRNHLLLTDREYDVIVSEPSNPWIAGVANLFTREFFELARARLTAEGLMAAWLHGYAMSIPDFQMVVRTLLDVFEHVTIWDLGANDYLLVASDQPLTVPWRRFEARFMTPAVREDLYRIGIHRPAHVLARYIAGDRPLRNWVGPGPLHTDDSARLEFSAPRNMYAHDALPLSLALVRLQSRPVADLLTGIDVATADRLTGEVDASIAGRHASVRAEAAHMERDYVEELDCLVRGHRSDPSNMELFRQLLSIRAGLRGSGLAGSSDPRVRVLLTQIENIEPPPTVSPRGASLSKIAADLRDAGDAAAHQGRWPRAAYLMRQAWWLEPDHRQTVLNLSEILMLGGRPGESGQVLDTYLATHPEDGTILFRRAVVAASVGEHDEALALLGRALATGDVAPSELANDKYLRRAMADEPRFQALLRSQPRPTTAPTTEPVR